MTTTVAIDGIAQAPGKINYQAVARNTSTGVEVANQPIFISLKILEDNPEGAIVYQENHNDIQTNSFGLFNLFIGGGESVSGEFQNIDWSSGNYWLEIDIDAGDGLQTMGSIQFVSVPYALHSETVTNADDADADPTNELVTEFEFNEETQDLSVVLPAYTLTQNLSSLINDADADPTNELVTGFEFNETTGDLSIEQANTTFTQNLNSLTDDADADPSNELITNIFFDSSTSSFNIVQQNDTLSEDLSMLQNDADSDPSNEAITNVQLLEENLIINEVSNFSVSLSQLKNDDDADPQNELITNLELFNDTIFRILEGGNTTEIDFGSLKRDADWKISEDGETLSNYGSKVGIGTADPKSTLQVNGSIGYKTTLLNNTFGSVNYTIDSTDHIIVCNIGLPAIADVNITMPSAAAFPGRQITIRKTGVTPILADVNIDLGSDLLDFQNVDYEMNQFQRETVTFISLGSAGWTIIYTE